MKLKPGYGPFVPSGHETNQDYSTVKFLSAAK